MSNKTAMITGGCRGIGLAISRKLLAEGYQVSILGTARIEKVEPVLDQLRQIGNVLYLPGNLAITGDRQAYLESTLTRFGQIDLLVNNAGVAPDQRLDLLEMSEASYDRVMEINLKGPLFLSQIVARAMLQQPDPAAGPDMPPQSRRPRGMIINIGSVSAETISLNRSEYCLSKNGMAMMTRLFAARLADQRIFVYEIRPGIIDTDMTAGARAKYDDLIEQGEFPIRRWGQPQDVADAVALLASGGLSYSTGDVLNVDGGFHIRRL